MSTVIHYYRRPAFRPGVEYLIGETRIVFSYHDVVSFDIDCNKAASREVARLCRALEEGLDLTNGLPQFDEFAPYADDILQALDRYGFLTETAPPEAGRARTRTPHWTEAAVVLGRPRAKAHPVLNQAFALDERVEPS
jgi:hypothetical protein